MAITERERHFMYLAIEEARKGMFAGRGGPFGCIVVKGEEVIGKGCNCVLSTNDPTAHAEIMAIRNACENLGYFQLTGCEIYCTGEPCPMCFGAIYWARPDIVYYANTKQQANEIDFDDAFIFQQLTIKDPSLQKIPFIHLGDADAVRLYEEWKFLPDKGLY